MVAFMSLDEREKEKSTVQRPRNCFIATLNRETDKEKAEGNKEK